MCCPRTGHDKLATTGGLTKNWSTRLESLIEATVEYGINAIGSGGRAATKEISGEQKERKILPISRYSRRKRERKRRRNDVEEGSGCRNSSPLWKHAISYTVHWTTHHEVQDPSAGLTRDGWRKK